MIVLASTSSTRQSMLRNAGVPFTVSAPQVDERRLASANPHWTPSEMALGLAQAKALEVSLRHPAALVVGADQVLALGSKTFGKPRNRDECHGQLMELRGRPHSLISGIALTRNGEAVWTHAAEARLTMRDFSAEFLSDYLDTIGEDCTSSVGGYKVEGIGVQLFSSIAGDHFTILGMPLLPLLEELRRGGEIET